MRSGRVLQATVALVLLPVFVWALRPAPPTLTRGPYLQDVTPTAITLVFRTASGVPSTLRLGTRSHGPWEIERSLGSRETHVYRVDGLRPERRYYYEIASGGTLLVGGPDYSFRTSPPENSRAPVRFIAWGDSGDGSSMQRAIAERMDELEPRPRFALGLGDLVYENGEWESFDPFLFLPYRSLFRRAVFWPALGNHDYRTEEGAPYFDAFYLPTTTGAPDHGSGTEKYYSFDHGMAHFVCIDSESSDHRPGSAMYRWIADDLDDARARGKRWLFAFMHHPPYTRGSHNSDTEAELIALRQNLVPLLESRGVDMVLVGHSHVYERSYLAKNHMILQDDASEYTKIGSPDGAIYLVSGCGGKTDAGALNHPLMAVSRGEVAGFTVIDLTYAQLRGFFVDQDGRTTDLFTVHKSEDRFPPRVVSVVAKDLDQVDVVFSEPVRAGTSSGGAEDPARYRLGGGSVLQATLASDRRTVTLTTTRAQSHRCARLVVQGVADVEGNVAGGAQETFYVPYAPESLALVPRGSTWRYFKGLTEPPPAWRSLVFDASAWPQGRAGFGYDDGDDATVLADMRDRYATVYLRTRFTVEDLSEVVDLFLNVSYDDGFVAFLNGTEVARANVPGGQTHATLALRSREAAGFERFDLRGSLSHLVEGTNVLAVVGHNSQLGSNDFSLHPELVMVHRPIEGSPPVAAMDREIRTAHPGTRIAFNAAYSSDPDGSPLRYFWDFGDGVKKVGRSVEHLFDREGVYTVTLLVRDRERLESIDQRQVNIHSHGLAPIAQVSTSSTHVDAGDRVDFGSSGSRDPDGGALRLHWDFGDPDNGPANESSLASPSHTFSTPGTYEVTLIATDDEGSTVARTVTISVD